MGLVLVTTLFYFNLAAKAEMPEACMAKLGNHLLKIEIIKRQATRDLNGQVDLLKKHLKAGEEKKLEEGCGRVTTALDSYLSDKNQNTHTAVLKRFDNVVGELSTQTKLLESLVFRDRASWEANIKALKEKGYDVSVDLEALKITVSKDLTGKKTGEGTQRLVAVAKLCSRGGGPFGTTESKIKAGEDESAEESGLSTLSSEKYAQLHLPPGCGVERQMGLEFLRTSGSLLSPVGPGVTPTEISKVDTAK